MLYWLYKCNLEVGPAGYWGDWRNSVFASTAEEVEWGGDYSTSSNEVHKHLAESIAAGDVVAAYQTDERSVAGLCVVTRMTGRPGDRKVWLAPLHELPPGFAIHEHKHGTPLEDSAAVGGPVLLRELDKREMQALVRLAGAPVQVLKGQASVKRAKPGASS